MTEEQLSQNNEGQEAPTDELAQLKKQAEERERQLLRSREKQATKARLAAINAELLELERPEAQEKMPGPEGIYKGVSMAKVFTLEELPFDKGLIKQMAVQHLAGQLKAKMGEMPLGAFEKRQLEVYGEEVATFAAKKKSSPHLPPHLLNAEVNRAKAALQIVQLRTGLALTPFIDFG